ncbi:MAG: DNA replication and repair protein RecF [Candidatus Anoxychlamydiales bacterium]|nr:DNA replication and repair protein RecF [Candidatus Anoxychlamydiales bacterium]
MFLKTLSLRNFRNYSNFTINFSDSLNLICGENAIGKTNLLEAINLISTGKSFRTLNLKELIKHQTNFFFIEAEIITKNLSQIIKIYYDGTTKKITHNANSYPSFTSLLGILPSTLHSPDDLNLIKGKPTSRRKFLNLYLAQEDPLYVHHYLRFTKALKQRNHLLKSKKSHLLKPFNIELAKSAAYLTMKRNSFLKTLQKPLKETLKNLSDVLEKPKIYYLSSIQDEKDLEKTNLSYLKTLEQNQKKDLDFKTTLIGPHRDDFSINFSGKSAKSFASEGQKKMLLYAIRFAEWELLHSKYEVNPLFLIDDFDAHLDEKHKRNLKQALKKFSQVFITMPKPHENFENAHFINLEDQNI